MTNTLKLGLNDVNNEAYHGDKTFLSSSSLKLILEDKKTFYKKHILKIVDEKQNNQAALDLGSYVHALCLEPDVAEKEFISFTGVRRGKAWELFKEENKDKTILGDLQIVQAKMLQAALEESQIAKSILVGGYVEHTLCTELDGLPIKVRADYIDPVRGIIADIKTTSKPINYANLQKTIASFHYDLSAALYVDAFSKFYERPFEFYFIFLCKENNSCVVAKCSVSLINNGKLKYKRAIRTYEESVASHNWLAEELLVINPAPWDLEKEFMDSKQAMERLSDLETAICTTEALIAHGSAGLAEMYKDALKYYIREKEKLTLLIQNGEI